MLACGDRFSGWLTYPLLVFIVVRLGNYICNYCVCSKVNIACNMFIVSQRQAMFMYCLCSKALNLSGFMSAQKMDRGKKRKRDKAYYRKCAKKQKGSKPAHHLEPGLRGFLLTCNNREQEARRDAYSLLNEHANQLYGPEMVWYSITGHL